MSRAPAIAPPVGIYVFHARDIPRVGCDAPPPLVTLPLCVIINTRSSHRYAGSQKPVLLAIGLTIHNAPVELREKLAVPEAEWPRAIEELCAYPHVEEAAVLSTCNRMELYVVAASWHRGVREVEDWLSRSSSVPLEELRPYLFLLRDRDATHHLLRVAGGLDSLVMGEGQILAQVSGHVHEVMAFATSCHARQRTTQILGSHECPCTHGLLTDVIRPLPDPSRSVRCTRLVRTRRALVATSMGCSSRPSPPASACAPRPRSRPGPSRSARPLRSSRSSSCPPASLTTQSECDGRPCLVYLTRRITGSLLGPQLYHVGLMKYGESCCG